MMRSFIKFADTLSASMGKPGEFNDKDVQDAMNSVTQTAKRLNFPMGVHVIEPNPDELKSRVDEGHTFLAYSLDFRMIDFCSRQIIPIIK